MFQIVVDSAANIPAELVKKYQIQVFSAFVNYADGKELVCFDPSLSPEEERARGKNIMTQCVQAWMSKLD